LCKEYIEVKSLVAFAAVAAVSALSAPAFAQSSQGLALPVVGPVSFNAGIGYTGVNIDSADYGLLTLRGRADFAKYFGVEGEASVGMVDQSKEINGVTVSTHVNDQYAAYGVVHYPVLPSANLFVRGGYGHTDFTASPTALPKTSAGFDSWNYGAGAEYFWEKNGMRVEYTRMDFQDRGLDHADNISVSYVRKF
jgi:outer membrane immunogenic protein